MDQISEGKNSVDASWLIAQVDEENKYKLNRFKFRAECLAHILGFLYLFIAMEASKNRSIGRKVNTWKSVTLNFDPEFPGVEVEMVALYTTLDEFRYAMSKVQDGHVMIESLNYACVYTGDRWYGTPFYDQETGKKIVCP